ncbi:MULTISPECIES: hypothetical protein [Streptomyces]|uniref:hypothetical protein n=1 Tax=Streptomyces TaxID=1883 RepID=UPI0034350DFA
MRAAERVAEAPGGQYGDWNRFAIVEGLRDTAYAVPGPAPGGDASRLLLDEAVDGRLRDLVSRWCARGDLLALALALPACLGHLGTDEDRARLRTALHMVHAARRLPEDEQAELGTVIGSAALR